MTAPPDPPAARPSLPTRVLGWVWRQPYLLLTFTTIFWGGNAVAGRFAANVTIPPLSFAFFRWIGAFVLVMLVLRPPVRRDWPAIRRHWRTIVPLGVAGIALFQGLLYTGLNHTTALNGLLLQAVMPAGVIVISFLAFRETITAVQAVGVVLGLVGSVVIMSQGDMARVLALSLNRGDVYVALGILCYAGYTAFLRLKPDIDGRSFLAVTFALCWLSFLPFFVRDVLTGPIVADPIGLVPIGYVMVFPSLVSYLCFNRGVDLIGANRAGVFIYLVPVFGALMAMLILGERLQLFHLAGGGVIAAGIVLAERGRRKSG